MRNVLVLGGSRGIGAAIVRRFATAGATVAFTYSGSQAAAAALAKEVGAEAINADRTPLASVTGAAARFRAWSRDRRIRPAPAATKARPKLPQSPPAS